MGQHMPRFLQVLDLELVLVKVSLSLVERLDLFFLAEFFLLNILLELLNHGSLLL